MKVAYFGDGNSHTRAAADFLYPTAEKFGFPTVSKTVAAFEDGSIDVAVLPIENSGGGTVADTLDALYRHNLFITADVFLPIRHALIGLKGCKIGDIQTVYSHPQALIQCERFLSERLPNARQAAALSTSDALVSVDSLIYAAIARQPGAGQEVLIGDIQDEKDNTTRFITLSRTAARRGSKVSLAFSVAHKTGALIDALGALKAHGLNLTKLESRPDRQNAFSYWFYLEFGLQNASLTDIMTALGKNADAIKLLGVYDTTEYKE